MTIVRSSAYTGHVVGQNTGHSLITGQFVIHFGNQPGELIPEPSGARRRPLEWLLCICLMLPPKVMSRHSTPDRIQVTAVEIQSFHISYMKANERKKCQTTALT